MRGRRYLLVSLLIGAWSLAAAEGGLPEGWETWTPRAEISPRFGVDPAGGISGHEALKISGNNVPGVHGSWRKKVGGIAPGHNYRLTAQYRTDGVPNERHSIAARVLWLDEKGERARPADYANDGPKENGWTRVELESPAPENARSAVIELLFSWAPKGSVWWDNVRLAENPTPRDRAIRVMTIFHRPRETGSAAESVEQFCRIVEAAAPQKPDIVCLPEGISVIGTSKSYVDVSEPVPGPITRRLGELARKISGYIVAGIYERSGTLTYNTAVLIDRKGALVGKYRKTHLPSEEVADGLTPGDSYPVFVTDFGKIGIMICWDLQFPEPARALAAQGAEIILLPIWGGSEIMARTRAMENHVFLVSSSYDMKTFIVDPAGTVLAEATSAEPVASVEIHPDRRIFQVWIGDMRARTWKERRTDLRVP